MAATVEKPVELKPVPVSQLSSKVRRDEVARYIIEQIFTEKKLINRAFCFASIN